MAFLLLAAQLIAPASPRPPRASPKAPVQPSPSPSPAAVETGYEIGPADILHVTVYGHEDLTQTVVVQSDGTFTYPLIGRVKASEHTPDGLAKKLALLLGQRFIRKPQVTVVVQEFRSKNIYVMGAVTRPGPYPMSGAMTLVEALARAGPLTSKAAAEIVVVRPPSGKTAGPILPQPPASGTGVTVDPAAAEVIKVNLRDIEAGNLANNIALRPNDTVFVPEAPQVFVSGEVRNPGAYAYQPGLTVRQLVSMAGGLTPEGSMGRLRAVRKKDGKSKAVKIGVDDPIQPGDTLVVRRKMF